MTTNSPEAQPQGVVLLRCPFCPSLKVMMWVSDKDGEKCCCGFCEGCQAEGPHANTEQDAARLWNTRADLPCATVDATIESVLAELREMFPRGPLRAESNAETHTEFNDDPAGSTSYARIVISCFTPNSARSFTGLTLADCMAQVRAAAQTKAERGEK